MKIYIYTSHEVQGEHRVLRVGWFQSEEYRPIVVTKPAG